MQDIKRVTIHEFHWLFKSLQDFQESRGEPKPTYYPKQDDKSIVACLNDPYGGFGEEEFYSSFDLKAADLFYMFIKRHTVENGNKRIAVQVTIWFIYKNGRWCTISEKGLHALAKLIVDTPSEEKEKWVLFLSEIFEGEIRKRTKALNALMFINVIGILIKVIIVKSIKALKKF